MRPAGKIANENVVKDIEGERWVLVSEVIAELSKAGQPGASWGAQGPAAFIERRFG